MMEGASPATAGERTPQFAALPDLLFEVDRELRIVAAHVPREGDLHVSPERFLGRLCADVIPAPVHRAFQNAHHQAHRLHGVATFEYRLATQRGEEQDFEGRCVALPGGGTLLVVRNVTASRERRTARAITAIQDSADASSELASMAGQLEWLEAQVRQGTEDEPAEARRERSEGMLETIAVLAGAIARLRLAAEGAFGKGGADA